MRHFVVPKELANSTQNKFLMLSENKSPKMNNTASTGFLLSGKGFYTKNYNYKKIFSGLSQKSEVSKIEDNSESSIKKINETNKFKTIDSLQTPIPKTKFKFNKLTPKKTPKKISDIRTPKLDNKKELKSSLKPLEKEKITPNNT